jgi:leucyl aminopeptidase
MKYKIKNSAFIALALATSGMVYAGDTTSHIVIAPKCLLQQTEDTYQTLATDNEFALIQTTDAGIETLANTKSHRGKPCGGFKDVTNSWHSASLKINNNASAFLMAHSKPVKSQTSSAAYKVRYQTQVNQLLADVNPQTIWANLTTLTSHPDRYSKSDEGVKVAAWIKSQMETIAKDTGHDDVTAYYVQTGGSYKQPSVVVKVGNSNEAGIVIGAHMDTLSSSWELKPGADDDGSGSATVLEAARTLLASGMHFNKPIYFIWYAAEEQGLVGSQRVVADFKQKKIPVNAVVHFDMTGYAYQNETTMWLMDDYTNKDLTSFISDLITTYVKKPVKHSNCGYACSDHASWTEAGFAASIPAEAAYENTNPSLHTSRDTMDKLSLDHMTDYAKLAVAAAVEFAEPVTK